MTLKSTIVALVAVAAALMQLGCGGGTDRTKAQVRLVNASSDYTTLELNVDGQQLQGQVNYGNTASYAAMEPGKADTTTITQPGSATALLSFTPSVSKDRYYTLLAYGNSGALKQLLLDDNSGAADDNKTSLRVVNAAPDAGSLDVYLTGANDLLTAFSPVLSGVALGVPATASVTSGSWHLRVTLGGSKTDVRLDLPALGLSSKQVATLVLTPGTGGALVNALLLVQQSDITRLDNVQARVRVAAGVSSGGTVSVKLNGTSFLSNFSAQAVGNYSLVSAGSPSVEVTVKGATVSTVPFTLAAGGDYTLLVRGTPAAAFANWIPDDNHLPSDATQAKLRLLNGVAEVVAPLAMTVDLVPVADSVAGGTASAYAVVPPSTTAAMSVTAAGLSKPLTSLITQTLVAGGTYTVFVLGAPDPVTGLATTQLRKDR
jgi:Domain of unknown function (DUF4397)